MHALPTLLIIDFIRLALDVLVCSTIFLLKFPCDILYYFSLKVELCPQILFLLHLVFIFMYGCHKMGYGFSRSQQDSFTSVSEDTMLENIMNEKHCF